MFDQNGQNPHHVDGEGAHNCRCGYWGAQVKPAVKEQIIAITMPLRMSMVMSMSMAILNDLPAVLEMKMEAMKKRREAASQR